MKARVEYTEPSVDGKTYGRTSIRLYQETEAVRAQGTIEHVPGWVTSRAEIITANPDLIQWLLDRQSEMKRISVSVKTPLLTQAATELLVIDFSCSLDDDVLAQSFTCRYGKPITTIKRTAATTP